MKAQALAILLAAASGCAHTHVLPSVSSSCRAEYIGRLMHPMEITRHNVAALLEHYCEALERAGDDSPFTKKVLI